MFSITDKENKILKTGEKLKQDRELLDTMEWQFNFCIDNKNIPTTVRSGQESGRKRKIFKHKEHITAQMSI